MLGSLAEMSLEENRQVFTPEANTPGETEHFFIAIKKAEESDFLSKVVRQHIIVS
jgi:hypothetical protein